MFSRNTNTSDRQGLVLGAGISLVLLLTLSTGACGRKGDPMPPPSKVPASPPDLVAQQQGPEIVLRFSYPTATESGLPLTEIEGVHVLSYQRAAPELVEAPVEDAVVVEGAEADELGAADETEVEQALAGEDDAAQEAEGDAEGAAEDVDDVSEEEVDPLSALLEGASDEEDTEVPLPTVDRVTFANLAGIIQEIDGADLGGYVDGNQVVVRLTDETFRSEPWIHAYAVVVTANGRNSAPSNIAVVSPVAPPQEITTAEVEGSEEGVRIRWQLLDNETVTGYNVYRRSAEESEFGVPFGTTAPDQDWFVDTSAEMGSRWVYAVTAVGQRGVESGWGNQKEIFYRDVYPPPVPTALVAIPDVEGIRLLWRHQPTDDHRGFVITRSHGDTTEVLTDSPVTGLEFSDRTATSGIEYTYHVVAIDEAGNSSEASEAVSIVAP